MLALCLKLLQWNLLRNKNQNIIMILAVIGSLSSYILLGTAITSISVELAQSQRPGWPFDISVTNTTKDEQEAIETMKGVYHTEELSVGEVYFFSQKQKLIGQPEANTKLILELESGALPTNERQVAIPGELAKPYKLEVGDTVTLRSSQTVARSYDFEIVGILSTKSGVIRSLLVTDEAFDLVNPHRNGAKSLLIQLDGKTDIQRTFYKIKDLNQKLDVQIDAIGYEETQNSLKISDTLVANLRFLILAISAASLAVLFYISQRSGAYQTGVMRAMGVQRHWLLIPPLVQTLLVFLISTAITLIWLPMISKTLGLNSSPQSTVSSVGWDIMVFIIVGLFSTLAVNLQFLKYPIPRLFKDAW